MESDVRHELRALRGYVFLSTAVLGIISLKASGAVR